MYPFMILMCYCICISCSIDEREQFLTEALKQFKEEGGLL